MVSPIAGVEDTIQLDVLRHNPEATSRKSESHVADIIVEAADSHGNSSQAINIQATIDDMPDGGYGWVIVAACSLISFFHIGLTYSWGIVQARLSASHLAKDSTLSFIGSTAVAFVSFAALVNARIIRRLGTRNSALLGCFSLGFGQILNGWASYSIAGLFVTNGIIVGFGTSLCFMTCGSLPAQYFKRRRGLANGFVFAGGGIGGGVWSLSISSLIVRVGIPWTFRILGLITLTMTMPAAMLLKERARRAPATVEWRLFLDPKFILLFLGSGLATFPILVPAFFIPLYANSLGASAFTASALLALFNLSSAVGRVGFGALGDRHASYMARVRKPCAARGIHSIERDRERRVFLDDAECCRAYIRVLACCERVGYGGDGLGFWIPPRLSRRRMVTRRVRRVECWTHCLPTCDLFRGFPVSAECGADHSHETHGDEKENRRVRIEAKF